MDRHEFSNAPSRMLLPSVVVVFVKHLNFVAQQFHRLAASSTSLNTFESNMRMHAALGHGLLAVYHLLNPASTLQHHQSYVFTNRPHKPPSVDCECETVRRMKNTTPDECLDYCVWRDAFKGKASLAMIDELEVGHFEIKRRKEDDDRQWKRMSPWMWHQV